jgi:hypothetical protein
MKLYHFCQEKNLESIAEKGLYPHVPHESIMSLGLSVVWLTASETTGVTDEDLEHFRGLYFTEEEIEEIRTAGYWIRAEPTVSQSGSAPITSLLITATSFAGMPT